MSEDITKELPMSENEKLDQILTVLRNVISGLNGLDNRIATLENDLASLKAGTNPFWQVMHDQQRKILENLQDHTARIERLEAHLQQQDERMDRIEAHLQQQDKKIEDGFRKLKDKFDLLLEDTLEWRADVRDLQRRVTRLEPIN